MTPLFEILANLCFGAVCADHVLPVSHSMTQQQCEANAAQVVSAWTGTHREYTAKGQSCMSVAALAPKAAPVTEITPNHFVHFGKVEDVVGGSDGDVANTGFIIGADGVAVIDSGTTRFVGESLYLAVRQKTDLPIDWLILTHMHPDHILGAEVFQEAGAEVIGSENLNSAVGIRAESYVGNMRRLLGEKQVHGTKVILPTKAVSGTFEIDLGGRVLALANYKTAHTNNDLSVFDQTSSTLWTGDLAFLEHVPALDGSINGWIDVLEALTKMDARAIIPGHGRFVADHPDGLQPTLSYLKALRLEVREALAKGENLATTASHAGSGLKADWQMFDSFNARNATNAYVELEWE